MLSRTILWSGCASSGRSVSGTHDYYAGGAPFLKKRGSRALSTPWMPNTVEREIARSLPLCAFWFSVCKRLDSYHGVAQLTVGSCKEHSSTVTRRQLAVSSHVGCCARACREQRLPNLCRKPSTRYSHKGRRGRVLQIRDDPRYRPEEPERRAAFRLHWIRRPQVRSYATCSHARAQRSFITANARAVLKHHWRARTISWSEKYY